MKIRTDFVTNSSSSCFCAMLTLQFDEDENKTLQISAFDLNGDGDYFDRCGRAGPVGMEKWGITKNFARIAAARNDMRDLFYVLDSLLNPSEKQKAYAVWDAEKLTRADLSIHSCVEGEYSFKADTYDLLAISRKDEKGTYEEELDRLKKSGLVYSDEALETIVLYGDADCEKNYKELGRKRGIRYGAGDFSKSIYLHMRPDGKLDANISYGKKYSPGYRPANRSTWVIDKEKLNELKRRKQEFEQKRIAEKKEKLSQEIRECISETGIEADAEILERLIKGGQNCIDRMHSEQDIMNLFRKLTAKIKEPSQQISLEGKILLCPESFDKAALLSPAVERLGGYLTNEIQADDCDLYVVPDGPLGLMEDAYADIQNTEKILLSNLLSQILHAKPIPKDTAAERCAEAKERLARKQESLREKELSKLIQKIDQNLNSLTNLPEAAEIKVVIEGEPEGFSIQEALERGRKIQIRDHIFDIHSRDINTVPTFLSKLRAVCPEWNYNMEDYNQLEELIERAGGAMARHVRKEQKYADYHIQHEFTTEPEPWYRKEGQPDYGIPAIGILSILEALRHAPAVRSSERKSFQELAALKEEVLQAKEEEKERKEKEWRDERDREEIVQFGQVLEELIKLNDERPFRTLKEVEDSDAVARICREHDFISFNRIRELIKSQKKVTVSEYLKTIGVLSPENKKRYAEKQKELSDESYEECIQFIRKRYEGREYLRSFKLFKKSFLDVPGVLEAIIYEICKEKQDLKKVSGLKLVTERQEVVSNPLTWKGFEDYIQEKYHVTVEQYMIQDSES